MKLTYSALEGCMPSLFFPHSVSEVNYAHERTTQRVRYAHVLERSSSYNNLVRYSLSALLLSKQYIRAVITSWKRYLRNDIAARIFHSFSTHSDLLWICCHRETPQTFIKLYARSWSGSGYDSPCRTRCLMLSQLFPTRVFAQYETRSWRRQMRPFFFFFSGFSCHSVYRGTFKVEPFNRLAAKKRTSIEGWM